jgi:phospholipid/cholesterol/gamma-HCH transport system substrate-binding protein
MNKNSKNSIKLGIFVSVGVAFLIAAVYFVGIRQHLFSHTFRLSAIFSNINGLQVGSNVRFSGINVGIVEDIQQITDSTVQVDMEIEEGSRKYIKQNAKAAISSDGLMGDKIITITPGKPGMGVVEDNHMLESVSAVSMDAILLNMKITSDNAVRITDQLAYILENVGEGNGMIGKLFFDSAFAETMEGTIVNLKAGAGGFKQNMDAASNSFLLKGYLKRKNKEKEAAATEKEDKSKDDLKKKEKEEKAELKAEEKQKAKDKNKEN